MTRKGPSLVFDLLILTTLGLAIGFSFGIPAEAADLPRAVAVATGGFLILDILVDRLRNRQRTGRTDKQENEKEAMPRGNAAAQGGLRGYCKALSPGDKRFYLTTTGLLLVYPLMLLFGVMAGLVSIALYGFWVMRVRLRAAIIITLLSAAVLHLFFAEILGTRLYEGLLV